MFKSVDVITLKPNIKEYNLPDLLICVIAILLQYKFYQQR